MKWLVSFSLQAFAPVAISDKVSLDGNYHAATNCTTVPTVLIYNEIVCTGSNKTQELEAVEQILVWGAGEQSYAMA